jgi:hypothetical protein
VKNDVKSENVTFFTAGSPAVSRANGPGTVLDGPMGDDGLIYNANDTLDRTFRCRIVPRKKARTTSAGLGRLPTSEAENFVDATTTGGSD